MLGQCQNISPVFSIKENQTNNMPSTEQAAIIRAGLRLINAFVPQGEQYSPP